MIPEVPFKRATRATSLSATNDCRVGRAVGGGLPRTRKDNRGMGAITALSTRANDGDHTARIMRKDRATSRKVTRSRIAGHEMTADALARIAARKALRAALAA